LAQLYIFLANRDPFTTALKTKLDAELKDDEVLEEVAEACGDLLERGSFVYPDTKHVLLKALAFSLVLLDKEGLEKKKEHLFKNKKSMDRFSKLVKVCPPNFSSLFFPLQHFFFPLSRPLLSSPSLET
jgi:hypothetical protein